MDRRDDLHAGGDTRRLATVASTAASAAVNAGVAAQRGDHCSFLSLCAYAVYPDIRMADEFGFRLSGRLFRADSNSRPAGERQGHGGPAQGHARSAELADGGGRCAAHRRGPETPYR